MEAIGPVLILFSLPLMFRWVPPNRFFGLRIPSTLRNRSIWYDANALTARHLFILGVVLVCDRQAENCKHPVAGNVRDVAAVALLDHLTAHRLVAPDEAAVGLRLSSSPTGGRQIAGSANGNSA